MNVAIAPACSLAFERFWLGGILVPSTAASPDLGISSYRRV
jgi:hypothetical protein